MSAPIPAKLYKLQRFTAESLQNLRQGALWFSSPSNFNDPFDANLDVVKSDWTEEETLHALDFLARGSSYAAAIRDQYRQGGMTEDIREGIQAGAASGLEGIRRRYHREIGVACLTAKVDDVLMWSHYADGHKGFCLEFTTRSEPFLRPHPVSYADEVPILSITEFMADESATPSPAFRALALTKASCWRYEQEWRILHTVGGQGLRYDSGALTGIYFGVEMPAPQAEILSLILQGTSTIRYQMKKVGGAFSIEPQRIG